jgi:hypothetical protein
MSSPRRFPPPWTMIERREFFEIRDAFGNHPAYI